MFRIYFLPDWESPAEVLYTTEEPTSLMILGGDIEKKSNILSEVKFRLLKGNPFYERFNSALNEILIEEDGVITFRGRLVKEEDNVKDKELTFESIEDVFNDVGFIIEGFTLPDRKIHTVISTILDSLKLNKFKNVMVGTLREYTGFQVIPNSYSTSTYTINTDEILSQDTVDTLGDFINRIKSHNNFFFKFEHEFKNISTKTGVVTKMYPIPIDLSYEGSREHILVYGHSAQNVKKDRDYSQLLNTSWIAYGDLSLEHMRVSQNLDSINNQGGYSRTKKDERILTGDTAQKEVDSDIVKYSEPLINLSCDFVDLNAIRDGVPKVLRIGDKVTIKEPTGEIIYSGLLISIKYNLFSSYNKKLEIGSPKINIFE